MSSITFRIEDKDFFIPQDYLEHESFTIKSSPKNYGVGWDRQADPAQSVLSLMDENPHNVLLIDQNVYRLYFEDKNIPEDRLFLIEASEEVKNVHTALKVIEFLEERGFTKAETLLVVGGGVVQDLGAFVGACYKRGIKWVFYPTTLLAMCDSCIGGKTGLNHNVAKNQVALFSAPSKVVLNINFLKTLPAQEIKSGLGEIYKLLITGGEDVFSVYEGLVKGGAVTDIEDLKTLILTSLYVKKSVIEEDEFEANYRKSLNYGHTFGHALEVLGNYSLPHGQAVALGIVIVNKISFDKGLLPKNDYERLKKYALELIDAKTAKVIDTENLLSIVKKDKKVLGSSISLVLIKGLGSTVFVKTELAPSVAADAGAIIREEL